MLSDALLWTLCKAGGHCSACSPKDAACGQQTALAKSCVWLSGSSVSAEPRLPGAKSLTGQGVSRQVQGSPGFPVMYRGPLDCARQIAASEGLRGFYRRASLHADTAFDARLCSGARAQPCCGEDSAPPRLPACRARLPQRVRSATPELGSLSLIRKPGCTARASLTSREVRYVHVR